MLNSQIIAKVQESFVNNCIALIGRAYDKLYASGYVNHDMNENTVSENLRKLMFEELSSSPNGIMVAREQPINNYGLLAPNQNADALPRIDFQFMGSWSRKQQMSLFFIEAKNLYANDFIKTGRHRITSAKYYYNRYVESGIMRLLTGYYPSNTYILGYVLEGTVCDAVIGVNARISSMLSPMEVLLPNKPLYPSFSSYKSTHNKGRVLSHLMLQF